MVKFSEEKAKGNITHLIPVHLNKMRCDEYFWYWSGVTVDWVRGNKIPEQLNKMYRQQTDKNTYL